MTNPIPVLRPAELDPETPLASLAWRPDLEALYLAPWLDAYRTTRDPVDVSLRRVFEDEPPAEPDDPIAMAARGSLARPDPAAEPLAGAEILVDVDAPEGIPFSAGAAISESQAAALAVVRNQAARVNNWLAAPLHESGFWRDTSYLAGPNPETGDLAETRRALTAHTDAIEQDLRTQHRLASAVWRASGLSGLDWQHYITTEMHIHETAGRIGRIVRLHHIPRSAWRHRLNSALYRTPPNAPLTGRLLRLAAQAAGSVADWPLQAALPGAGAPVLTVRDLRELVHAAAEQNDPLARVDLRAGGRAPERLPREPAEPAQRTPYVTDAAGRPV